MFKTQPTRHFIPNLTFNNNHLYFFVCDHAGVVHSKPHSLASSKRVLVQLVVGFVFGEEYLLGYDSMMKDSGGVITTILVSGEVYTIIKKLFSLSMMRGCATQCCHVWSIDGQEYIIKDS